MKKVIPNTIRPNNVLQSKISPFHKTKKLFNDYLKIDEPLTYEAWMQLDPCDKVAALYVNFFDTITLAYWKVASPYSPEEDNVSIALQYLQKNVSIIEKDSKRYTERYIYRVMYNCLNCESLYVVRNINKYNYETSDIYYDNNGMETSVYDTFQGKNLTTEEEFDKEEFWECISRLGEDAVILVDCLINRSMLPPGMKAKKPKIIQQLKELLKDYMYDNF